MDEAKFHKSGWTLAAALRRTISESKLTSLTLLERQKLEYKQSIADAVEDDERARLRTLSRQVEVELIAARNDVWRQFRLPLVSGHMLGAARKGSLDSPLYVMERDQWISILAFDVPTSTFGVGTPDGLTFYAARFWSLVEAPDAPTRLSGASLGEVIKRCIIEDPEVQNAIDVMPENLRYFIMGLFPKKLFAWPVSHRYVLHIWQHQSEVPEIIDNQEFERFLEIVTRKHKRLFDWLRAGGLKLAPMGPAGQELSPLEPAVWIIEGNSVEKSIAGYLYELAKGQNWLPGEDLENIRCVAQTKTVAPTPPRERVKGQPGRRVQHDWPRAIDCVKAKLAVAKSLPKSGRELAEMVEHCFLDTGKPAPDLRTIEKALPKLLPMEWKMAARADPA